MFLIKQVTLLSMDIHKRKSVELCAIECRKLFSYRVFQTNTFLNIRRVALLKNILFINRITRNTTK
jgi:hypothetical protein